VINAPLIVIILGLFIPKNKENSKNLQEKPFPLTEKRSLLEAYDIKLPKTSQWDAVVKPDASVCLFILYKHI